MATIHLQTPIPGPRSQALAARRARAVLAGVATLHPIFVDSAQGATVTDVDGNTFIDFTGGLGVMNVGHADPRVTAAITAQAARFTHTCFQVMGYEPYVKVAEELARIAPGAFDTRVLLVSTGAEAVENAVKIARAATGRGAVLCFEHGFHGRTLLALSLTGKASPYKSGFGPFVPDVYRLPFPYAFRGQGIQGSIDQALETLVRAGDLAAIVIEPVLGEGGFVVAPRAFVQELRALATKHGIVLVIDEVQSGFGRTGTMFACEQMGIEPDLLVVAKSVAAGLPLAAVVGRADLMDRIQPGGVGGTFGGNPVACAAAIEAIAGIESAIASGHAERLGNRLRARLERLAATLAIIGDVRGLGAIQAIELVRDRATREPAADETAAIVAEARALGLLLFPAGTYRNVIRFLLPITSALELLDEGLEVLDTAMHRVVARFVPQG
jgi:4-aminobutyrate aminotransferase / (S)-3-amino-2-methylpropionate transaminase / 5-aminovalerate transaminase